MKKLITFFAIFFMVLAVFSQDCNIGNSNSSDPNFTIGNFSINYLLGVKFTLSEVGVLHALNMIGNGSGVNFQMAIYDDNGGVPNDLLAYTNISTVGTGIISLPVTPLQLEGGDYWLMAIYDELDGNHSNVNHSSQRSPVYYTALPFGNPIPENASDFLTYNGQDFLYFATISCGPLSINEFIENKFSISPNPASNFITIGNFHANKIFTIYDVNGKKIIEEKLDPLNNQIDVSSLDNGVYFLKSDSHSVTKFLKN